MPHMDQHFDTQYRHDQQDHHDAGVLHGNEHEGLWLQQDSAADTTVVNLSQNQQQQPDSTAEQDSIPPNYTPQQWQQWQQWQ